MWAYGVCQIINGQPDLGGLPFRGYCQLAKAGGWGLYLVSGSAAQLSSIGALANVYPLVAMTDNGILKWAELDNVVTAAHRTKLNNWLTARGYPTIPAGWTYRQILMAILQRLRGRVDDWNIEESWVTDV